MPRLQQILACCLILLSCSCGSNQSPAVPESVTDSSYAANLNDFPAELPLDSLLPGESLDSAGLVLPARNAVASAIGLDSEFQTGRDYFSASVDVSPSGVAAQLASTAGASSWAIHRIALGGSEPGLLSVDANLLPAAQSGQSSYYVGIANYASGRWDWHGPFSDSHVRLSLPAGASYLSPLGNAFTAVLCHNGSAIELVGLALDARDGSDSTAPGQVQGLTLSPVSGGLELQWNPVLAADLAGYRVCYASKSFVNPQSAGVQAVNYLEGSQRQLLPLPAGKWFIGLSAVDLSGNAGPLSTLGSAVVPSGSLPELGLTLSGNNASLGEQLTLNVAGAARYDLDLDGDGVFEISDSTDTAYNFAPPQPGLIRPRLRGHSADGMAVALGGLSVVVSVANLPPFADLDADSHKVAIGEALKFSAANSDDLDGSIAKYEWDFDGDGTFETDTGTTPSVSHSWDSAGYYNTTLRVTDNEGDSDLAFFKLTVRGAVMRELTDADSGSGVQLISVGNKPGLLLTSFNDAKNYYLQALDEEGENWSPPTKINDDLIINLNAVSAAVVNGKPALAYYSFIDSQPRFTLADNASGSSWGAPVMIANENIGVPCELSVINGNPAVMLGDGGAVIKYVRASTATGSAWNAPVMIANESSCRSFNLLDGEDGPYALFQDQVVLGEFSVIVSMDGDGTNWAAPVPIGDPLLSASEYLSVVRTGAGFLSVHTSWVDTYFQLRVSANTSAGGSDWGYPRSITDNAITTNCRLAVVNGLPVLVYMDSAGPGLKLIFQRAVDANGFGWEPPLVIGDGLAGLLTTMDVIQAGDRAIVAFTGFTNNKLRLTTVYY